ncbi:hypothetical protein KDL44_05250 [bacterium]|nr:hypothetical protein [bacterium]
MRPGTYIYVVLAGLLLGSGCARAGAPEASQPVNPQLPAATAEAAFSEGIPSPSALLRAASADHPGQQLDGSSYSTAFGPQRVAGADSTAVFTPDWLQGDSESAMQPAWAAWMLDLSSETDTNVLKLDWKAAPQQAYVALADWGSDRWIWRSLSNPAELEFLPAASLLHPDDNTLACVILATGQDQSVLNGIQAVFRDELPGGFINDGNPLGMNLEGLADWGRSIPFTDVFRLSRSWIPQEAEGWTWDTGETLDIDANGWVASLEPGQAAGNVLVTNNAGNYPEGDYICLYDGEGTITWGINASVVSEEPGRQVVHITPGADNTAHIKITATNSADPVRNIRLILPGHEADYMDNIWNPDFVATLEPFSCLRFMDLQNTNGTQVEHWSERTTPDHSSQARAAGICPEYLVLLANQAQKDPWFCMPHRADDDYITQFATLVRDTLDPELRIYIEYSNEVWNGSFPAAGYAQERGLALGLSENAYEAHLRYYSQRSVEIFAIWQQVFSGQEDRLVRVISGQHVNAWAADQILDWQNAYEHADCYATAPYFGGGIGSSPNADAALTMSLAEIVQFCADSLPQNYATMQENAEDAHSRGLKLIAYEGGQHMVGYGEWQNNDALTAKLTAANRDPGMRQVYADYLANWSLAGGERFMAFSHIGGYGRYGSWGVMERLAQPLSESPKLQGLLDWQATQQD